jgi:hypothetical protein
MTRANTLSATVLGWLLAAGCAVDGKNPSSDEDSDGGGDDYSSEDNNTGGPDLDDEGADVLPTYPTARPRIYVEANRARLKAALDAGTPAATKFKSTIDGWVMGGKIWNFSVWNAALLGQLTGDSRYCAKSIAAVDADVAADEALIRAGKQPIVAQNSYLHVGEILGDLALVYDWCFDTVTPAQKQRWIAYANLTLTNLWNPTQAKWGPTAMPWTGWSVNNPSNNYYYSFLRATMLVGLATKGEDPKADEWIAKFRDEKVLGQLVPEFDAQLRGGGSREGSAYGTAMRNLWQIYDIWYSTTGEKLQAKTKHARQSIRAFMHHVVPTLDRFAPTGDQPRDMTAAFFDYQREYLQGLVHLYPNDPIAGRAKALLENSSQPAHTRPETLVADFLYDMDDVTSKPLEGLGTSYYASGIGQVYARSGWDRSATWINFTAGAYTESHAHQDQGSLLIYKDGWLGYDGVINSANGIIQEVGSHSLVRINSGGTPLKQIVNTEGRMEATRVGQGWFYAAADVTAAYGGNAAVGKVQREVLFLEPNTIVVYDRVATGAGTTQTWQLAAPVAPSISGTTATINGAHPLRVQRLVPASGATSSAYSLASTSNYRGGYRLDTTQSGGDRRYLHVMSIDGSVSSATASGDTTATIALGNGQTATVAFERDSIGATLTYGGTTVTLGPGHDTLPE